MASPLPQKVSRLKPLLSIHRSIPSVRAMRKALQPQISVGFVPTMGALHEGHLSLMRQARCENDVVVASIFVNPTQFGPTEDLDKYPRQFEQDSEHLREIGVDHLFAPDANDMYGKNHVTYIDPRGFDETAEGVSRPGHFGGVATIVTKLFNIVQPTNAYFGQKDAAQCVLIKRIVEDLNMDINIIVKDTIREPDGLAMSSRNAYLIPAERDAAPVVYRALCAGRTCYEKLMPTSLNGELESATVQNAVRSVLSQEPLVKAVQYVSIDDRATMRPLPVIRRNEGAIVSVACKVGSVRLIDNIILDAEV